MTSFFDSFVTLLINFINQIGYFGIFIGMFLESTVIPVPSEFIMIPAGISAAVNGETNVYIAVIAGIAGNVCGAVFSYYLASSIGRSVLFFIGKYFFVKPATIIKIETFFKSHGPISILMGRLLPGFRHFISLFAGIAKMDFRLFLFYTVTGSTIWTSTLVALGFFIGENQETIKSLLHIIIIALAVFCTVVIGTYTLLNRRKKVIGNDQ